MKVLAAITDDAAAAAVLAGADAIANMAAASIEALHVGDENAAVVQAAQNAGAPLRIVGGRAIDVLVGACAAEDVAAIVIGRGASSAGEHAPGSTTTALVTLLEKPVVVVPPNATVEHRVQRVLVPLNGETQGTAAVQDVMQLAANVMPQVVLAHVYDERSLPAFSDQLSHEVRAWREEFIARHCPPGLDARLELRVGEPHEHLLDVLRRSACDLVALSWSQDLTGEHAAVVRRMLAESPVPVLLMPEHASHAPQDGHSGEG
jgi:nucleotide-binding universal stress UspA family protein